MNFNYLPKNSKYKLIMFESDLPNSTSGKVDAELEEDNTFYLSVYNNPVLYRRLKRTMEKYL